MKIPFERTNAEASDEFDEIFPPRVRMTCTTAAGATYAASVSPDISQEALEALDAVADAVIRQFMEKNACKI